MAKSFIELLEAYPELKEHVEDVLDVVENIEGRADKANDAEILFVDNMVSGKCSHLLICNKQDLI
jgi:hypothetical protein